MTWGLKHHCDALETVCRVSHGRAMLGGPLVTSPKTHTCPHIPQANSSVPGRDAQPSRPSPHGSSNGKCAWSRGESCARKTGGHAVEVTVKSPPPRQHRHLKSPSAHRPTTPFSLTAWAVQPGLASLAHRTPPGLASRKAPGPSASPESPPGSFPPGQFFESPLSTKRYSD